MNSKNYAIGILSLTALILFVANMIAPVPAQATNVIKDRDYQMITGKVVSGGDGLYIVDNRTGQMCIFTYDTRTRAIVPRSVRPVTDAFIAK